MARYPNFIACYFLFLAQQFSPSPSHFPSSPLNLS